MNRLSSSTRLSPLANLLISDLVSVATSGNFTSSSSSASSSSHQVLSPSCLVNNGSTNNGGKGRRNGASATKSGSTFKNKTSPKKRHSGAAEKYQSAALDLSSKKKRELEENECSGNTFGGSKKGGNSSSTLDKNKFCDPFEYLTGKGEKPHGLLLRLFPSSLKELERTSFISGTKSTGNDDPTQTSNRAKNDLDGKNQPFSCTHTLLTSSDSEPSLPLFYRTCTQFFMASRVCVYSFIQNIAVHTHTLNPK